MNDIQELEKGYVALTEQEISTLRTNLRIEKEKNESLRLKIDKLTIDNAILRRDKRIIEKELVRLSRLSSNDPGVNQIIQLIRLLKQR